MSSDKTALITGSDKILGAVLLTIWPLVALISSLMVVLTKMQPSGLPVTFVHKAGRIGGDGNVVDKAMQNAWWKLGWGILAGLTYWQAMRDKTTYSVSGAK